MTANLQAAVEACPSQKIVLLGYSQGGKFPLQFYVEKSKLRTED